jgi:Capsule polysaccharide export protein
MSQSLQPGDLGAGMNNDEYLLSDILALIWKKRLFVIVFSAVVTIATAGVLQIARMMPPEKSFLPNKYSPQATVLLGSTSSSDSLSSSLSSISGLTGLSGIGGGNSKGALAVELSKSKSTLDLLIDKMDLKSNKENKMLTQEQLRGKIRSHIKAKYDSATNILTITYTDIDPLVARDSVNGVVDVLSERFASLGGTKASAQRDILEKKLTEVKNSMDNLETRIKQFQDKYGVIDVQALATEQISVLAQMRSQLILKEIEIANYKKVAQIDDPQLQNLNGERESLLSKIKELESGVSNSGSSKIMPSQKEIPAIAFEYEKLERDMMVQTEVYKLLTQQYELAKLNANGQDPVFQILELAEVLDQPSEPNRKKILVITFVLSFVMAIIGVFLMRSVHNLKNNPEIIAKFH